MKIENVTSAKKEKDRSITLVITDPVTRTKIKKRFADIRGGISWPTSKASACFCVLGQEYLPLEEDERPKEVKGKRILLAEFESKSLGLSSFYKKITDIAEQFLCRVFYAELPEDRNECGYMNDLNKIASGRGSKLYISEAFDANNFQNGLSRIDDSIKMKELVIPEDSIVYSQLQNLAHEELENKPEEIYSAINALRHVLGSYYRSAPVLRRISSRRPPRNWRAM